MARVSTHLRFHAKRFNRLPLTFMLRNLVTWNDSRDWADGYTVVIACMKDLAPVAIANIRYCSRLDLSRLDQILLVFDCIPAEIPESVKAAIDELTESVPVKLIGYSKRQAMVAHRINWGWVYSWLSWSLGIAHARTRAVILHDLDALPMSTDLFERLHDNWSAENVHFCGIRNYKGNNVPDEMSLVTTFEMVLDAEHVRRHFRPFDLFNKLELVDGRIVDFDTTLAIQRPPSRRAVRPINESDLLHPSRLICQYTDLCAGRKNFDGEDHGLFMLIYFLYLGGDSAELGPAGERLADPNCLDLPLFGKKCCINGIQPESWAWMEKQIRRTEQHFFGKTRAEIVEFLEGFIQRAGSHRTVGAETGPLAVADY